MFFSVKTLNKISTAKKIKNVAIVNTALSVGQFDTSLKKSCIHGRWGVRRVCGTSSLQISVICWIFFIFMVVPRLEHRTLIELGFPQTAFPEPYENIEIGDRALVGQTLTRAGAINIT